MQVRFFFRNRINQLISTVDMTQKMRGKLHPVDSFSFEIDCGLAHGNFPGRIRGNPRRKK